MFILSDGSGEGFKGEADPPRWLTQSQLNLSGIVKGGSMRDIFSKNKLKKVLGALNISRCGSNRDGAH